MGREAAPTCQTQRGVRHDRSRSPQVFAPRSGFGWPRVSCSVPTYVVLAFRLGLARRSLGLPDDDRWHLGVFLILAARDPLANLSLIWFTVWSSAVHGTIMAVQAVTQQGQMGHLAGDVPSLFIVAVALAILTPRSRLAARTRTHDGA